MSALPLAKSTTAPNVPLVPMGKTTIGSLKIVMPPVPKLELRTRSQGKEREYVADLDIRPVTPSAALLVRMKLELLENVVLQAQHLTLMELVSNHLTFLERNETVLSTSNLTLHPLISVWMGMPTTPSAPPKPPLARLKEGTKTNTNVSIPLPIYNLVVDAPRLAREPTVL